MSCAKQVTAPLTAELRSLPGRVGFPQAPDPRQWEAMLGPVGPGEGTCAATGPSP